MRIIIIGMFLCAFAGGSRASGESAFVGNYGEVISLSDHWKAEAVMKEGMEVVRFRIRVENPDTSIAPKPFDPKPTDYTPENFNRLRLMQLIVIPKNAPGGLRSLDDIRKEKLSGLDSAGIAYETHGAGSDWPPDSFWVSISTPYRLWQRYAQSDENFFIFTAGIGPADAVKHSTVSLEGIQARGLLDVEKSLSGYLATFSRKFEKAGIVRALPKLLAPWWAVSVFALLAAFAPGGAGWIERVRLIGRGTFVCAGALQVIFLPILTVAWFTRQEQVINAYTLIFAAIILMPGVCWACSRLAHGARPGRAFLWSGGVSCVLVAWNFGFFWQPLRSPESDLLAYSLFGLCAFLGALGLVGGIVFGLTHEQGAGSGRSQQ